MTEIMGLNTFDIIVIALILLLSIKGLISGFTKELFSAIGLIGGIFMASYFHKDVAEYIYTNLTDAVSIKVLNLLSLIVIFALFFTIVNYLGKGFALIGSDDYISATSRFAGMIIKMLTLFFVFSLIVYAFSSRPQVTEKFKDTLESSKLYPLLKSTGAAILNMPIISNVSTNSNSEENTTNVEEVKTDTNATIKENNSSSESVNKTEDKNSTNVSAKLEENSTKLEQNSTAK